MWGALPFIAIMSMPSTNPITNYGLGLISLMFLAGLLLIPLAQPGLLLGNVALSFVLFALIWDLGRRGAVRPRALGLRLPHFGWVLGAIPASLAAYLVVGLISLNISQGTSETLSEYNQELLNTQTDRQMLYTLLTLAIAVPIIEELVFRGALQTYLSRFFPVVASAALAALIFALAHTGALAAATTFSDQIFILMGLGSVGFIAGLMRAASGSLLPAFIVHGLYNAILFNLSILRQAIDAIETGQEPTNLTASLMPLVLTLA